MPLQFLQHLQIVMNIQQKRNQEANKERNGGFKWLCNTKKATACPLATIDEFLIRQALKQVTPEQQVVIIKQLLNWLDQRPVISPSYIPQMALQLLHQCSQSNLMEKINFKRANSLRSSLRLFRNKVTPQDLHKTETIQHRAIYFNDVPKVYFIEY